MCGAWVDGKSIVSESLRKKDEEEDETRGKETTLEEERFFSHCEMVFVCVLEMGLSIRLFMYRKGTSVENWFINDSGK